MNKEEIKKLYNSKLSKDYPTYYDLLEHTTYIKNLNNQLQQQNKKYKEVIFTIKNIISKRIKEYQQKIDNEIDMGSQGDYFKICRYEEQVKFLKDILKEVE